MNYFAIGDIHGNMDHLNNILKFWNPDKELLIFLGDLIDRGTSSYDVVQEVMNLKKKYGARVIKGNHEEMFLNFLEDPKNEHEVYLGNGGDQTISSFLKQKVTIDSDLDIIVRRLQNDFSEEIDFLSEMISYIETDNYIFAHAGLDFNYLNWRTQEEHNFRWIRNPFIYGTNDTGKTVVFGHTVTRYLNKDKSDNVWFSPCGTKIGIDGAAVFGGKLHGLKIIDNEISIHSV